MPLLPSILANTSSSCATENSQPVIGIFHACENPFDCGALGLQVNPSRANEDLEQYALLGNTSTSSDLVSLVSASIPMPVKVKRTSSKDYTTRWVVEEYPTALVFLVMHTPCRELHNIVALHTTGFTDRPVF